MRMKSEKAEASKILETNLIRSKNEREGRKYSVLILRMRKKCSPKTPKKMSRSRKPKSLSNQSKSTEQVKEEKVKEIEEENEELEEEKDLLKNKEAEVNADETPLLIRIKSYLKPRSLSLSLSLSMQMNMTPKKWMIK